jgi:hypothetical protein
MATQPQPEQPAQPSQPAQPTQAPPEVAPPVPDIDVPAPGPAAPTG